MNTQHLITYSIVAWMCVFLFGCTPKPQKDIKVMDDIPNIYPDYTDVTIPMNIAPLNFLVRDSVDAVECIVEYNDVEIRVNTKGNKVSFSEKSWKKLLQAAKGNDIKVTLSALYDGEQWRQWQFAWHVANDSIDPYLTYRLVEPDYEIFNHLELRERNVETFEERAIVSYKSVGNRCMNCHTFANQSPDMSMMYVRGEHGGAILNQQGTLTKLNIKTDDMVSGSVYFAFSPSGRYIVFSTNTIIPAFHSMPSKRLEVFDNESDIYVADLHTHTIIQSPLLANPDKQETFPTFSPDGKSIYFCSANNVALPQDVKKLHYSLCRIPFDEWNGTIGNHVDTLVNTQQLTGKWSVSHPKVSPDGRFLLFTVADYGTFPIWHPEADLRMVDLQTGIIDNLTLVNSHKSDTYHSWSSNSRWFVFASKRDDGLYGKPYFCFVDKQGKAHKPFVLPQKSPAFYDDCLKSFNVPELGKGRLPFSKDDVKRAMQQEPISFSFQ